MENEINMLKAQIEPHFLFNTLNRISATVPPQHEATRELIARLADTFRYALRSTKEEKVPLQDELCFIRNYLELEKARFGNRLAIRIEAGNISNVMIAPMLLQPLVENAIAHGISPSVNGGTVSITCCRQSDRLLISVSDDALPFQGNLEKLLCCNGVGLKNTAIRIERIYRQKIRIEKNIPGGLTFSFLHSTYRSGRLSRRTTIASESALNHVFRNNLAWASRYLLVRILIFSFPAISLCVIPSPILSCNTCFCCTGIFSRACLYCSMFSFSSKSFSGILSNSCLE